MYYITGRMRILRKPLTRYLGVNPDGSDRIEIIGNENTLQQEFRCGKYGNTEWRDVPIVHEQAKDNEI